MDLLAGDLWQSNKMIEAMWALTYSTFIVLLTPKSNPSCHALQVTEDIFTSQRTVQNESEVQYLYPSKASH